ncbi:MAG: ATP-binding protein [Methanoregulaceae archaeon]
MNHRITLLPRSRRSIRRGPFVQAEYRKKPVRINQMIRGYQAPSIHIPLPLFWLDTDTMKILAGNAAAGRLTGYRKRELENLPVTSLFPEAISRITQLLRIARSRHRLLRQTGMRTVLVTRNMMQQQIRLYVDKTRNTRKNRSLILFVIIDDCNILRELEYYKKANAKLHLLSSITRHDILNQVTALKVQLELSKLETADTDLLEYIKNEETVTDIISQQIEFTRDYQDIGINAPQWFDVKKIIENAIKTIKLGPVVVSIEFDKLEIFADPLLERVFFNLIENALRHGKKLTKITFSYKESNDNLILICMDDGIGIPPENKELIFTRGFGSNSGEGLFFVHQLVDLQGMSIRETGTYGEGARFDIRIPHGAFRKTGSGY